MLRTLKILTIIFCLGIFNIGYAQTFYASKIKGEQTKQYEYITISYDIRHGIPFYVGETLTTELITGDAVREKYFHNDNLTYVTTSHYLDTGWDRGHMAPAADFKGSTRGMYESFSIANIAPQAPKLNRVYWEQLEEHIRSLVRRCDTLYVVTGTIIDDHPEKFTTEVYIPVAFYKAVLGIKNGNKTISCAWIYNNYEFEQTIHQNKMTIDKLEKIIGVNLFPMLNKGDRKIEAKIYE